MTRAAWLAFALLAGCARVLVHAESPAVIEAPDAASRAALAAALLDALRTAPVLDRDALTVDSRLVIERSLRGDGRSSERPEHFQLLLSHGRCVLLQESSGRRWVLARTRCVPRPGA